ncbi:MAG: hypothetical protein U9N41_01265 [Euryarchaeota archaeon]|nr:hypothetical protein [Euryarchaeota archaeon]
MAVLINKNGNIVATHSIKISGHYDPERWDRDKVSVFIEEKMRLLRDKADIELLQVNGDNIDVVVYVSEPDNPPHIIKSYARFWIMTNDLTGQNGLFVDKIDVDESNFENGMYLVVGHYKSKNKTAK